MTIATDPNAAREDDPGLWAWAFLRRNPAYRADYRAWRQGRRPDLALRWGLARALDPALVEPIGDIWAAPDGAAFSSWARP